MNSGRQSNANKNLNSQKNAFSVVEVVPTENSTTQAFQPTLHYTQGSISDHDSARSQFLNYLINDANTYNLLSQFPIPGTNQTNNRINMDNPSSAYPQFMFSTPASMQSQMQIPMQNQVQSGQTPQPATNYNFNDFIFSNELSLKSKAMQPPQEKRKIVTPKKTINKPSGNSQQNSSPEQRPSSVPGNSTATISMQLMAQNQNNNTSQNEFYSTQFPNNNELRKIIFSLKQTNDRKTFEQLFKTIKKWFLGEVDVDDPAIGEFRLGELFMNALNLRINTVDLLSWLSTNKKFTVTQFRNIDDSENPSASYFRAKLSQYIGGFAKQVLEESDKQFLQYLITLLPGTKFVKDLLDAFLRKISAIETSEEYRKGLIDVYNIVRQTNDISNFYAGTYEIADADLITLTFDGATAENSKEESNMSTRTPHL